jgi:hypothetical protein
VRAKSKFVFPLVGAVGATLFAVYFANEFLAGSIPAAMHANPETIEKYINYLDALLTSVDQLVSMLVTIQLSLFVLAGFSLNSQLRENRVPSAALVIFDGVFVITALMSLTLGYTARIQASTLIQWGVSEFESVRKTVVDESILVALSAVAAVCMMVAALADANGSTDLRKRTDVPHPKPPETSVPEVEEIERSPAEGLPSQNSPKPGEHKNR